VVVVLTYISGRKNAAGTSITGDLGRPKEKFRPGIDTNALSIVGLSLEEMGTFNDPKEPIYIFTKLKQHRPQAQS
jgi:hypothetical protein